MRTLPVFLFESESLLRTSASQAGVLTAMLPVFVAVGARIFLAEHITRSLALGSCVSIAGIAWLTGQRGQCRCAGLCSATCC